MDAQLEFVRGAPALSDGAQVGRLAYVIVEPTGEATDVPIMVVSGTNRKRDAVLSLRLGADDFVSKPFDVAELEERVKTVLRRAA